MREIACEAIVAEVARLCIHANTVLSEDLCQVIKEAQQQETAPVGRAILGDCVENFTFAAQKGLPICQDTGMAVVFVELGQEVHITGGLLEESIHQGVAKGYVEGNLRLSVVEDPLRRVNTNNNTPAIIHMKVVAGDKLDITVAPKGFGSENMSALHMFTPSATREDVIDFIVESVSKAGSNPCPPVVVGVGLGGTAEKAAQLAKEGLLRNLTQCNPDPFYQAMEQEALDRINRLGIGPQGLGGNTTALAVVIKPFATHIAGMPCCVNMGCHVTRHAHSIL